MASVRPTIDVAEAFSPLKLDDLFTSPEGFDRLTIEEDDLTPPLTNSDWTPTERDVMSPFNRDQDTPTPQNTIATQLFPRLLQMSKEGSLIMNLHQIGLNKKVGDLFTQEEIALSIRITHTFQRVLSMNYQVITGHPHIPLTLGCIQEANYLVRQTFIALKELLLQYVTDEDKIQAINDAKYLIDLLEIILQLDPETIKDLFQQAVDIEDANIVHFLLRSNVIPNSLLFKTFNYVAAVGSLINMRFLSSIDGKNIPCALGVAYVAAAKYDQTGILNFLQKNPNTASKISHDYKVQAFLTSVEKRHEETIRYLLHSAFHQLDIEVVAKQGLEIAKTKGYPEIVKTLQDFLKEKGFTA